MKTNSKGYSTVLTILLAVLLLIIAFVGLKAIAGKASTEKEKTTSTQTTKSKDEKAPTNTSADTIEYFDIKEWGVRVSFDDADKVTYKFDANDPSLKYAALNFKESVIKNEKCRLLGVGLNRGAGPDEQSVSKRVGDYYYYIEGSYAACEGDDTDGPTNTLREEIINERLIAGNYTVTAL